MEDKVVAAPLIPGAEEFLTRFAAHIPCYVISGTPEDELQRIAERRGLSTFFKRLMGFPRSKEQGIELFLEDGPYPRDRVAMIGDAMTDHDAAVATGVPFVGVAPPGVPHFFPESTRTVRDLTELAAALNL